MVTSNPSLGEQLGQHAAEVEQLVVEDRDPAPAGPHAREQIVGRERVGEHAA